MLLQRAGEIRGVDIRYVGVDEIILVVDVIECKLFNGNLSHARALAFL